MEGAKCINSYFRVTIKYKHVADLIERSFFKDCAITEDNISIQGENGSIFKKSVGYFVAYKNAIQQLEYSAMIPNEKIREINEKIAKLSIEGHILSSRTAFIGVQKIDSNKPKPESNGTSEVCQRGDFYESSFMNIFTENFSGNGGRFSRRYCWSFGH